MLRRLEILGLLVILALPLSPLHAMNNNYPPSRKDRIAERLHGVLVDDPYRWLEDSDNPEVQKWTAAQNAYTRSVLDRLRGREKIHDRLAALLEIGSLGTPVPVKGQTFYTRREGKQNQPILYVRKGLDGKERVLLDPNRLDKAGTTALDWWFPSRDGRLLAYGLSKNGSEQSTLHVRDVATGDDLPDTIERTRACSLAWLPDASGFYYTRYPSPGGRTAKGDENYNRHVFFHKLGTDPAKDKRIFGPGRAKEDWPNVSLSPNGRWLVVTVEQGWARSEVYFRDLEAARPRFVPLVAGIKALYSVTVRNDRFYVLTNEKAPRYRLFAVDPRRPGRSQWKEIIAEGPDVLEGVGVVSGNLFALYMQKASSRLRWLDGDGKLIQELSGPTLGSITGLGAEWDGSELFFGFQSFTVPTSVYHLDMRAKKTVLWGQVKAGVDFAKYEVEQVSYPSKDGTAITMFLAHKKGLKRNGQNPTVLYGYGGFNISLTPTFNSSRFLFLEQGGLLAIPNLRGGGEYGEKWHEAGMLGNKQNVFDDFAAAAEYLIDKRYTSRQRLAILGGSNGGLLVGAALTQHPDLFRAVVCMVPLLDMIRYHKFLIARLWIPEYGSSENAGQFKFLHAYSPYHHVKEGTKYPAVLLEAAESDTRVHPLHARKMAARLQAATSSDRPVLLRLETKAGHGAGKPRAKVVEELTDVWSFLFTELGMKP